MRPLHNSKLSQAAQLTRRGLLQAGSLGLAGLSLPKLFAAEQQSGKVREGAAKSCILFFLEGGPSHVDLWDMKPDAPANVRGEFKPIQTSLPGVTVCEHLPMLSKQMHLLAQARAVHHKIVDHNAGAYYMLTGRPPVNSSGLIVKNEPDNFPPYGSVLTQLRPTDAVVPPFVQVPDVMSNLGYDLPGQMAGFMGGPFDPLVAGDPSVPNYQIPGLELAKDMPQRRLKARHALLAELNQSPLSGRQKTARFGAFQEKALELLGSTATRDAFDVSKESAKTRERYGLPDRTDRSVEARKFGGLPHTGQCMLMARRLIESGVRLVTVCSGRRIDQAWDTHRDHFPLLKKSLLPYTDQAFSALLEDMDQRGLLEETLVVMMGEFGRTPKLGQITSSAGAAAEGRDHWPHCYTVMFAGAGVKAGAIHGKSDRLGGYPLSGAVTPEDVAATIYHLMGINPETRIYDQFERPHHVALGEPIRELLS